MKISKSEYMLFLKHPAWLWLKKNDKKKLPPIDDDLQARFDEGYVFESFVEKLFPGAIKVGFNNYNEYLSLPQRTKSVLSSGAKVVTQAGFETLDTTCICDLMVKNNDETFNLYEIKSTTSAKTEHEYDLAFQIEVLEKNNIIVDKIFIIHVNSDYVRNGEINVKELTKITEVTQEVRDLKEFTKNNIVKALQTANQKECPDISPSKASFGAFGEWLEIYKTLVEIEEYSIYHLCAPGADKIGQLENLGIKKLIDIPEDFKLDVKQQRQVQATKNNDVLVNKDLIKEFLDKLEFPLYFLDYETLSSVIPLFDGLGPYKQLPFQYSLHKLERPDSQPEHFEYLHKNDENPVNDLTRALKTQIGVSGTVLVWYEGFEKSCNELMGKVSREHEQFYNQLNDRIIDLMVPFSTGAYAHKDFYGSASIKKVLPVLIPELSYKDLDIHAGGAAQRLWMDVALHGKRQDEKEKIFADLLKYCELDTLAMVRIYQFLKSVV